MGKFYKVLLNDGEVDAMMVFFGKEFLRLGDDDAMESPYGKKMESIHDKIVKAKNKQGMWYLWQLKDRDGGVVRENIKPEFLKLYDSLHYAD